MIEFFIIAYAAILVTILFFGLSLFLAVMLAFNDPWATIGVFLNELIAPPIAKDTPPKQERIDILV